jgi:DNA mismatch repair protein MutS
MLQQYYDIKKKHPNELLMFRLGDFYEVFGEDAKKASRILNIVLTARSKGTPNETPMCGIPHHALNNYLVKFMAAGQRVAICDQVSDPALPGLVKREVARVITPGTTLDDNTLDNKSNNFIVSLYLQKNIWGLAVADLTTGEFKTAQITDFNLLKNELFRLNASEVIIPESLMKNEDQTDFINNLKNTTAYNIPNFESSHSILTHHFKCNNLNSFGIEKMNTAIEASGALIHYLKDTQKTDLKHIYKITRYNFDTLMSLDEATIRNLELFFLTSTGEYDGSLLSVIDRTITNMGGRMLRRWVLSPLIKLEKIKQRHDVVGELKENHSLTKDLTEKLKQIADIERLVARISCNRTNARELVALKSSLQMLPEIKDLISECNALMLKNFIKEIPDHNELVKYLEEVFVSDPPVLITEGGMISDGFNESLDELRKISKGGKDWMNEFTAIEIERTGITSLKVKYNRVHGYYIEVSKTNLDQVPEDYIRKQTLVGAERFVTEELKEYETKILNAEEEIFNIERQILTEAVEKVMAHFEGISKTADIIAKLDVLLSFSIIANENNYNQPEVIENSKIEIKDGRHPVIEKFQKELYVPNDILLDHDKNEFLLLTGPNMSGKSSYLRQTALICLMAQIGSFVPAKSAKLSIVDRIFTRVGASDNLAQGISTFMAEMQEAANILNNATKNSLIILDELGRGTSTYDGVSIAWAMIEHIHNNVSAKTLFATHYHELTEVIDKLEKADNYCVAVSENEGNVVFLHKIVKGASSRSYGIEVAKLAGLPKELIYKATEILENLESKTALNNSTPQSTQATLPLTLTPKEKEITKQLSTIDPDKMTPIEALQKLSEIKDKLKD